MSGMDDYQFDGFNVAICHQVATLMQCAYAQFLAILKFASTQLFAIICIYSLFPHIFQCALLQLFIIILDENLDVKV